MVERRTASRGLRWAAAAAVLAAGGVTLFERLRIRHSGKPVQLATGRGRPLDPPSAMALAHGYETVDTNVRALVIIIAVSVALIIGGLAGVFTLYASFARQDRASAQRMTAEQKATIIPPEPHLQSNPYRDLNAALMEQTQVLTTYGWADADHKQPRIPIDRAMALVAGKPLDGQPLAKQPVGAAP
ncbi:hypothetical protein [Beijerinckia sp. L45]|uniref:hypothetical protein n=1 Tax=Beijerinckia sp. L45 TaxID=1641855 RepID=UPI00131B1C8E|nr:hypothetical protein [Beijerinckia sp. L45]